MEDPENQKLVDYEGSFNVSFNSIERIKVSRVSWWAFAGGGVGLSAILIWLTWGDSVEYGDAVICC